MLWVLYREPMATYTLAEIEEQLSDYADYEELADVSRAKSFVTWANRWLIQYPKRQEDEDSVMEYSLEFVNGLKASAQRFVSENAAASGGTNARTRFISLENFRG